MSGWALRDQVCIVGVGNTEYGSFPSNDANGLAAEALNRALVDSGLGLRDVDGMITSRIPAYDRFAEIVGINPRAVKRFVNIFRIIKAHDEFDYNATGDEALPSILFMIALPLGPYRKLLPSFEAFVLDDENDPKQMSAYIKSAPGAAELNFLKADLASLLSADRQSLRTLQKTTIEIMRKRYTFIRRFAFN